MTNKEAIPWLKGVLTFYRGNGYYDTQRREALKIAIKELERPQGEWIDTGYKEEYWEEEYQCSICGAKDHWHKFCPNCGAEMKGD